MTRLRMLLAALLPLVLALLALAAAWPAAAADNLIVGAIYVGSVNDYGYNRAMHDGLMAMKAAIPGVTVLEAENVPESAEAERVMEGMIQQGAKLIFATSFGHQQFAFNLAKKHPDVVFEHAGGWMQAANFGNFFGATQAAWYPMGVAAGKMTKPIRWASSPGVPIGYVIGNINAFALGARSVNPKVEVRVVVTGSWSDKAKEAAATGALIDQGADVVTMHVDSPATVIQTAESRGVYSIGFQSIEARAARAQRLAHRPRLHLGPVHDRDRQERDRRGFKPAWSARVWAKA
jgi:basic membrane protein A